MDRYACVMLGGGFGSLARYLVSRIFIQQFPRVYFATGTFFVNVTGSFLIGLAMTLLTEKFAVHANWRLLLVTGFLGGYTTFSTFEYDGLLSVRAGHPWVAGAYLTASVVAGLIGVCLGDLAARHA